MSKRNTTVKRKKEVPFWDKKPVQPKNPKQKTYINAIRNQAIVLGTGYPGTGKSYIPASLAAEMLEDPRSPIERIVICRPNEGIGKSIGMLKGGLNEKMIPWCAPILDVIKDRLGESQVEWMLENGVIELLPLEYARGKSYDNTFVILDEGQNVDKESLKCLMLRLGQDSRLVIDGDVGQCDIGEATGLGKLINLIDTYHTPIIHVDFEIEDIVRSDICKLLVEIFVEAKF